MDDHYRPLADAARGDEEARIISEWMYEADWPRNELAQLETWKLLSRAQRWLIDAPAVSDATSWVQAQENSTGNTYLNDAARLKLKKAIRDARRESARWWIQVVVLPLTGLIGVLIGLISLLTRRAN